jgi:hypothetical protein
MWDPGHLVTCYRDSFTFFLPHISLNSYTLWTVKRTMQFHSNTATSAVYREGTHVSGLLKHLSLQSFAVLTACHGAIIGTYSSLETPNIRKDHLYGLVARIPSYRSRGLDYIPGTTRFSEK